MRISGTVAVDDRGVRVDGRPLSPFVDSTDARNDGQELRRRGERDGYLFFRELLPAAEVLRVRRDVLDVLDGHGWLQAGHPVESGVVDAAAVDAIPDAEMGDGIGISAQGYVDVQKVQSMHALPHHPELLALCARLFGSEVFAHPRHIVRVSTSRRGTHATPPHQDFPLVQGTPRTWTCWFPLGDCPTELGPLAVLRGSHHRGYLPIEPREGAGGLGAQLCHGENDWVGGPFALGDVLTFPALTVHRALPAADRDHVRISMDVRYQRADEVIEARSLTNHSGAAWPEIYADWDDERLQYYWRDTTPTLSPWDDSLIQPGVRIC